MFWKVPTYSQASPLEGILEKQHFTLEELLDEEDLIQECKALNGRLLSFLLQPSAIEQLISYFTEQSPLPPGLSEAEVQKRWSKFPFAACEVFCCEVDAIFNTLFANEKLMAKLFSIVESDKLPDITLAGYFARVVKVLLVKRNQDMMDYLQKHQDVLTQLAQHLETTSMAEVMVFIVGAAEFSSNYATPETLDWLQHTEVSQHIMDQMRTGRAKDAQKNAAAVLAAIARSQISPLLSNMSHRAFLDQLTQHAFNSEALVSCQALDICIALLSPKQPLSNSFSTPGGLGTTASPPESPHADNDADRQLKEATVDSIAAYMQDISRKLDVGPSKTPGDQPSPSEPNHSNSSSAPGTAISALTEQAAGLAKGERTIETPFGLLKPPLGSLRLKLVELMSAMLRLGSPSAESSIMQAGVAQKALALLLQFPFNNLLHAQVTSLVLHALDSGTPAIVDHLFSGCNLVGWISHAPREVQPTPRPGDEEAAGGRRPIRAGYLGHLILLGNSLLEASSRRSDIRSALMASPDWHAYVRGPLAEANARQDVMQWACGRPSKETLSTFKSTDDIIIDEQEASEEGLPSRHLMRYNSMEDDPNDGPIEADHDQDFTDATDALGSLNLSEGWSNLSLRSRHSESGAQDLELRHQRGDSAEASSSGRGHPRPLDDPSDPLDPSLDDHSSEVTLDVGQFISRLLSAPQESGIDDDVLVMTEDFDDLMDEDAVVLPESSHREEKRTHGSSNWAAFDDFATERTSQLDSVFEQAKNQSPQYKPHLSTDQDASSPTAGGRPSQDWNAFGSTDTDWGNAEGSSSQQQSEHRPVSAAAGREGEDWDAFESTKAEWGSNDSSSQHGAEVQALPSASWSAFPESDATFADSNAASSPSTKAEEHRQSSDSSKPHFTDQQASEHAGDEESLRNADFGASMYWRTHPLALVDEIDS